MSYENEPMPKSYQEPKQEQLKYWEVNIRFLSVGCIITVGCKSIPFTDNKEAMKELINYVNNPQEVKEKWEKIFDQQN